MNSTQLNHLAQCHKNRLAEIEANADLSEHRVLVTNNASEV